MYPGGDGGATSLYEDDGLSNEYRTMREGRQGRGFANTSVEYRRTRDGQGRTERLMLTLVPKGGYSALPAERHVTLRLLEAVSMDVRDPSSVVVSVDGAVVPGGTSWAREPGTRYAGPGVRLTLPPVPTLRRTVVEIDFGEP